MCNLKLKKWIRWIGEIREDTCDLLSDRATCKRYLEIIKNNKKIQKPGYFHTWLMRNYGNHICMGVRRQLDTDRDVITLKKLLVDIEKNPEMITKAWFRTLYKDMDNNFPISSDDFADNDFEKVAGNLENVDPKIVENDLKKLEKLGTRIKKYADKKIAHRTKKEVSITFNEIDIFLDEFESLVKKYTLLLTASGYASLTPTVQFEWESIFTHPWIE